MKEIRNIIEVYDSINFDEEKIALASVVNVEESSYRRIGARMLVRSNGQWIGGISGGCLEGDALRRSQNAIFKNQPSRVVYDTMEDDQNQIGVGLGCNGRIEVLVTPIDPEYAQNEIEILKSIVDKTEPQILLKVIEAPEDPELLGQLMLVEPEQNTFDFAHLKDEDILEGISETHEKRKARIFEYTNSKGNRIKLLAEFLRPETHLIIVGDNYDILAMLGIAAQLGWKCSVVGKAKKLSKEVYRLAETVVDYDDANQLYVNEYTAVMLMSHDYNWDKTMLPVFLAKGPRYMGMLGPKKRFIKMKNELSDIDFDQIDHFHSPTGLEIGAESPAEIALSIAAEIVGTFRGKTGGSLHTKVGTIHERD